MKIDSGSNPYGTFNTLDVVNTLDVQSGDLELSGELVQTFTVQFRNESGVIMHRIVQGPNNLVASNYVDRITGASEVLAATPSVGASVDFVSGAGLLDSNAARVLFNTPDQTGSSNFMSATVEYYDGGVDFPSVNALLAANDINGNSRQRLQLWFHRLADGANFNINTTTLPAGTNLYAKVIAFLQ